MIKNNDRSLLKRHLFLIYSSLLVLVHLLRTKLIQYGNDIGILENIRSDMLLVGEGSGTYREILEEELNDPELIYKAFPEYERDSEQLVRLPETRLGAPGVLYVNQREFAATVPEDEMTKVCFLIIFFLLCINITIHLYYFIYLFVLSTLEVIVQQRAVLCALGIRAVEQ